MPDHPAMPVPADVEVERPYWESCRARAMRIQQCADCGKFRFYPGPVCDRCSSRNLTWELVTGNGVVYSFSEVHRTAHPAFETPYVVALVELEEGPVLTTNLVRCQAEEITIGAPVKVVYRDISPEWTAPVFELVRDGAN